MPIPNILIFKLFKKNICAQWQLLQGPQKSAKTKLKNTKTIFNSKNLKKYCFLANLFVFNAGLGFVQVQFPLVGVAQIFETVVKKHLFLKYFL